MSLTSRTIHLNKLACDTLTFPEGSVETVFALLEQRTPYHIPAGELSIAFVDNATISQIHADFLDDPTPTDVITFDGDPDMDFAGEICVSVEQALDATIDHGTTFAEELTLYLVHGWLHLAGLDDTEPELRAAMRAAEVESMTHLKDAQAIPKFALPTTKD